MKEENFLNNLIYHIFTKSSIKQKLFIMIILIYLTNFTSSQDDFELENNLNNPYGRYNDLEIPNHADFNNDRIDMQNNRIGGAHPGFRNMEENMGDINNRRFNNPGMGRGIRHGGGGGGHQNHHGGGGMRHNSYQNSQPQNIINNNNNNHHGAFGMFNSSIANSAYEFMMIIFLLGFVYNCFCGKNANDKYALAWYNANKQYFEERYSELGIKKDEELDDNSEALPIIKDSPYIYKFYASGYRFIKWVLVVLEFRKRQDTISLFTSFLFPSKDRIIYEVGISPCEEDISWIFCICNRRDSKDLKKQYQDIDFFCNVFEPSIMSDRLILMSESDELFCDLFQNKVKKYL